VRTRVIHLHEGQDRGNAQNARTGVLIDGPGSSPSAGAGGALGLLERTWSEVRKVVTSFTTAGVAVVAVDTLRQRVAASMCIAAKPGAINAGIVGRHGQCDLFLEGDPSLSLRHMVIVVEPLRDWGDAAGIDLRYRLIDLRTSSAFRDETGRRLEAATVEGPAFVFVGRYALYCFPTGGGDSAWPERATDAVAALPERIYLDERDAEPDRWKRGRHGHLAVRPSAPGPWAEGSQVHGEHRSQVITRVTSTHGPARARVDAPANDELSLGTLEISSRLGADRVRVGVEAAGRGLLLGRYSRCDTAGAASLALEKISRVHLLVVRVGDDLWAIDTASTNGVAADGQGVRVHRLRAGDELTLAEGSGAVRWQPAS
jgi:hypothetical protein